MEGRGRRADDGADEGDWRKLRLVPGKVHSVTGDVPERARSFCAALRRRLDLPGDAAGELVPGLPDGAERPGSGARRAAGAFVVRAVSGGGKEGVAAADEPGDSHHRGRNGGPGIRDGRSEGHAGARSKRFRTWEEAQTRRN